MVTRAMGEQVMQQGGSLLGIVLSMAGLASCNSLLGNEEGMLDPSYGQGGSSSGPAPSTSGRSGSDGSSGSSVAQPATATKLGAACTTSSDCTDTKAPGMICLTETQTVLNGAAPPNGLCTAPCGGSVNTCTAFGAGARCTRFAAGATEGYCMEGCSFGEPAEGELKCHDRRDFACAPLPYKRETSCTSSSDCEAGDQCYYGTCASISAACLPSCRGEEDCAAGWYCNQKSGRCVNEQPVGTKTLGQPCTVASDPSECLGYCAADGDGSPLGHCAVDCSSVRDCGWNPSTQVYDGVCFGDNQFIEDPATGDAGLCTLTCNCSAECMNSALSCRLIIESYQFPLDTYRGAGTCMVEPLASAFTAYEECGN